MDDYDTISQDASDFSDSLTIALNNKAKYGQLGRCSICGARSSGINFDVMTCSSCKAFFRRNGVKPLHQFVCRASGNCIIDERSRRQCTACRLRKCFEMGMVKERIRTEEQNQRHRALVEENRRQKLKKCQQQQEKEQRKSQKVYKSCRNEPIYSSSSSYSCDNQIDLICEIFLESVREVIPDEFRLDLNHDVTDGLNQYCMPVSSLITFSKHLSQFQQLPVDDRLILLKNNTKVLLPMFIHLLSTTTKTRIYFHHPGLHNINEKISYTYSLFSYNMPDDNKLLVLLFVVLLFSSSLLTSKSLYDAGQMNEHSRQMARYTYDEYAQLIWLYVSEKYDDNYGQAALVYMKIITTFLQLQNLTNEIYDIIECSVQIDRLHMIMQSVLHLT
ncbi:unnamed protein product [Adineta ricciae]|uniref:Nuclear receptor domain-containing protein n=1 Tax=Adineta ricciae TaxID=249248 RepID=A0A814HS54_ADIRI|nr:unnamed protein product [Adineta ricciae]CAF1416392.1 unnamed protein product [Adineta ricciae]